MKTYENKEELILAIKESCKKYIAEFSTISDNQKNVHCEGVDKSPYENLAYQLGWVHLLLEWEKKEKNGEKVYTPTKEFKWNNLGGLYQSFYKEYNSFTLEQEISLLNEKVNQICIWIDSLTEKELFEPDQRAWATTKARWPLYKWIHINTVAPFTNFRTQIRKWKKLSHTL